MPVPPVAPTPAAGSAPAASPPPSAPPTPEPATARRFVKHLPRAGLAIFLIAILVIFREVLLPFVLAVFCAYLIYPIVARLERIRVGRFRPPRWLAVISVYAALFVVGWYGIPPLLHNFLEQGRKLATSLPDQFKRLPTARREFDRWVAEKLEVTSLSHLTRREIDEDVEALAVGTIEPLTPPEDVLPPPPAPAEAKSAGESKSTTVVQLIAINLDGGAKAGESRPADPRRTDPTTRPSTSHTSDATAPDGSTDAATEEGKDPSKLPRRFTADQARTFERELEDAIEAELRKPGPAKQVPARVERELVPTLARKDLELPADDDKLAVLAHNTSLRVATAISQEDYVAVVNRYVDAGVQTAQSFVKEQLADLTGIVPGLAHGIFDFFMVLMLTAFFLCFFPRIRDYMRDLVAPQFRDDYAKVLERIDRRLSGAIRGQVIICMVNAVLTFPGMWLIGTHTDATNLASYSVVLSFLAGVLSIIPIFGVILSTVPMVLLSLTQGSIGGAALVIGWIAIVHSIEAYLLNPNILGHSASMNPIIVVFALLAGKAFGGLVGALLAVPIASVLVSLFGYYRRLVAESHAREEGVELPADVWAD
jgi:predicted PurR-regulated permease PerM